MFESEGILYMYMHTNVYTAKKQIEPASRLEAACI